MVLACRVAKLGSLLLRKDDMPSGIDNNALRFMEKSKWLCVVSAMYLYVGHDVI